MKYFIFLIPILYWGCSGSSHTGEKAENVEPSMEKIALKQGNRISSQAQQALGSQLMKRINSEGPVAAVEFCNLAAYPILDSLDIDLDVKIKRASIKTRNPGNKADAVEERIIRSYQQLLAKEKSLTPVVEALGKEELLYAAPIQTKNKMCLNCHGAVSNEISEATLAKIQDLYPGDNAKGHKVGDLRGIWSITFKKEELLKLQMDDNAALDVNDGLSLVKQNCYSCHSPNSASHDHIIAPPLEAVKRRYLRAADDDKRAFVSKMSRFLIDPSEQSALMKGPVRRFGVMPKFNWSEETIAKMVEYMYDHELEQPDWFEQHHREGHH